MPKILFVWNIASIDANIGSYRPSVFAAKNMGYEIDVVMNFSRTSSEKQKEIEKKLEIKLINVDIDRSPYSIRNYKAYNQLVEIMKNGNYDIIHCNTPIGGILGRLAAKKIKHHKVFYMNRGFAFYKGAPLKNWLIYYTIEKLFAHYLTDAIATINPEDFVYANKFKLRNGSKLKYSIPGPGVELSRFKYSEEDRKRIRSEYGIGNDDIVILSVGEITERKNFISIIEALGKIKSDGDVVDQVYYMIAGEGVLRDFLVEKAKEIGIQDKVLFVGYHNEISGFYSSADIYALPSISEGFGRVGIEAMSIGLPLITSNVQGINLYSVDGKTGFKYEAKDVDGYAKGILKLINDKKMRLEIGEYNRMFAKNFSMENSAKMISEVYKGLMCI